MTALELILLMAIVVNIFCNFIIIAFSAYIRSYIIKEMYILKKDHFDLNVTVCKLIDTIKETKYGHN